MQVNPLAESSDGRLIAADAKLGFDDNAAFRQKELFAKRDPSQEDPRCLFSHHIWSFEPCRRAEAFAMKVTKRKGAQSPDTKGGCSTRKDAHGHTADVRGYLGAQGGGSWQV